jgi:RNA polymerase sigma-70 factor (ECF subfamily)
MDEAAFASFYEATKRQLWLYVVHAVGDSSTADDIFQDTYVRFLQHEVRASGEEGRKAYLYRIAANLIRDHWRRRGRARKRFVEEHEEQAAAPAAETADARHDVAEALRQLAPQQRSMLWLAYVEACTHKEIAALLRVREGSVKVLLYRARQKLLEIFKHRGITPEATP